MSRIFRRKVWYYAICGVFSLIIAFAVFSGTASAHPASRAVLPISPVGTWNVTVNVLYGLTPGQQDQGTFTFTSKGTVSASVGGIPGTGIWESTTSTSPMNFAFQLKVTENGNTIYIFGHAVMANEGNGFTAYLVGTVTDPNGIGMLGNMGVLTGTRV